MKKNILRSITAVAAAAVMMTSVSSECAARTVSTASFNANSYVEISGEYAGKKVTLSWDKFPGAAKYSIYRSTDDGKYKLLASTSKLTYTDRTCKAGKTYKYKIYAVSGSKKSEASEIYYISIDKDTGDVEDYVFDEPTDYGKRPSNTNSGIEYADSVVAPAYAGDVCYEEIVDEMAEEEVVAEATETAAGDYEYDAYEKDYCPPYYINENITAGTLTCGRLEDNRYYSDYLKCFSNNEWSEYEQKWTLAPENRITVTVTDGKKPVENAKVQLLTKNDSPVLKFITDNRGIAYVFPEMTDKEVTSVKITTADGAFTKTVKLSEIKNNSLKVAFNGAAHAEKKLDVMFMVDTTGSMGDELRYLQKEMEDVINRVSKDNGNLPVRLSVNFYRDKGDDYVVRSFPFRTRISTVKRSLADQYASGGGDFPEAVHTALNVAFSKHNWESDSTKIMFLVLDAPPHDDDATMKNYKNRIITAAAKGIRIVPVISSGSDHETEYIMRTSAAVTGGTYIFLTDDSQVGNPHSEPLTDAYEVTKLNDMMVQVIDEYLK